jgi:hypothetical protein
MQRERRNGSTVAKTSKRHHQIHHTGEKVKFKYRERGEDTVRLKKGRKNPKNPNTITGDQGSSLELAAEIRNSMSKSTTAPRR